MALLPREMAVTFWLRINEKKHLFAGENYFLSILSLDALPGLLLAFSHRPKETFPLILNFGATELALPVARVWHRFTTQRNLARQWILQWPEHTATALIPLVFTKPGDNREAALLALRLLYAQGHGELLQTVANRWQRADVWPAPSNCLYRSHWKFTHHAFRKPLISGIRQCGAGHGLSIIISLLPMMLWKLLAKCCALLRVGVFIADWNN